VPDRARRCTRKRTDREHREHLSTASTWPDSGQRAPENDGQRVVRIIARRARPRFPIRSGLATDLLPSLGMLRKPARHQETPWRSPDGIKRISGGAGRPGDVVLIATVINGVALCLGCIAAKTGVPLGQVKPILDTVGKTVEITNSTAPCDACLNTRTVFRLA
jgi:hypothetical protein